MLTFIKDKSLKQYSVKDKYGDEIGSLSYWTGEWVFDPDQDLSYCINQQNLKQIFQMVRKLNRMEKNNAG